jgi:lectin-like protein
MRTRSSHVILLACGWLSSACGATDDDVLFRPTPPAAFSSASASAACVDTACVDAGSPATVSREVIDAGFVSVLEQARAESAALLPLSPPEPESVSVPAEALRPDAGVEDVSPDEAPAAPVPAPNPTPAACDLVFGDSCYRVSTAPANWFTAEADCSAWGGHLAIIATREEDDFVGSLLPSSIWLGANDASSPFGLWSDGSAIVYTNWAPAQPDVVPSLDCIEKRQVDGEPWFDQPCDNSELYVCERAL